MSFAQRRKAKAFSFLELLISMTLFVIGLLFVVGGLMAGGDIHLQDGAEFNYSKSTKTWP